jgi:hypothetical protein
VVLFYFFEDFVLGRIELHHLADLLVIFLFTVCDPSLDGLALLLARVLG